MGSIFSSLLLLLFFFFFFSSSLSNPNDNPLTLKGQNQPFSNTIFTTHWYFLGFLLFPVPLQNLRFHLLDFPNAASYWLSLLQVWMLKSRFWRFRLPCFRFLEVLKKLCDASVFEFPASRDWNLGALLIRSMLLWLPPFPSRRRCMAKFRFVFTGKNEIGVEERSFLCLLAADCTFDPLLCQFCGFRPFIWFRYFNLVHRIFDMAV